MDESGPGDPGMTTPRNRQGSGAARPLVLHARVVRGRGGGPEKTILVCPVPLEEIRRRMIAEGHEAPLIRPLVRTGDTDALQQADGLVPRRRARQMPVYAEHLRELPADAVHRIERG